MSPPNVGTQLALSSNAINLFLIRDASLYQEMDLKWTLQIEQAIELLSRMLGVARTWWLKRSSAVALVG